MIPSFLGNGLHLCQLVQTAHGQIQERQLVKVLRPLICGLDDLVVALLESLLGQADPALWAVDGFRSFQSDFEVAAFDSEFESSFLVLDEVEGDLRPSVNTSACNRATKTNLGEAFLLQVSDDTLSDQVRGSNDV